MNIGEIRIALKAYLEKKLRIDCWGLGLPDSINSPDRPPSIGLDKPALDIEFISTSGYGKNRIVTVETVIPFQVIYRFDASYKYNQLPRAEAETLLTQIKFDLQAPSCINPDISSLEASGSVSIAEHKNGDKLIVFELDIRTQFELENNSINTQYFSVQKEDTEEFIEVKPFSPSFNPAPNRLPLEKKPTLVHSSKVLTPTSHPITTVEKFVFRYQVLQYSGSDSFQLNQAVPEPQKLLLFINGCKATFSTEFNINGSTLNWLNTFPLEVSDIIEAYY